jgi:hypothetical protein
MSNNRKHPRICKTCKKPFKGTTLERDYCSIPCRNEGLKKPRPTKEELTLLLATHRFRGQPNLQKVSQLLSVDPRTLRKWIDEYFGKK